ncbi:MAG: RHS repeat-associated core domain-containing protein [Candidatus Bathyarchaeota archaeon]|nr:MAG: RHS repeat-associated core domain-containing protein [Candidatus Bathyarchaeota archaeon]
MTKHYYANGLHLAEDRDGIVEYYHQDHLGSTRLRTDGGGSSVFSRDYEPFGPDYGGSGSEEYKYTGKREDPSGLYYFGARYYDPGMGRFITEDPVLGEFSDPQSLNRYVYCMNTLHKYVDVDGRIAVMPILIFSLGISYIACEGFQRMSKYSEKHPDVTLGRKINEFLIGSAGAGVKTSASLSVPYMRTVASKTLTTKMEEINYYLDVPGYEEKPEYTIDEKFVDIQKDVVVVNIHKYTLPEPE